MAPSDPNKPSFHSPSADYGPHQAGPSGPAPPDPPTSSPSIGNSATDTGVHFHRSLPSVTLPTSGGAIRKVDEKFEINPSSGSCALTVPIPVSPARSASATPSLQLSYDSGAGNGPFGLGWGINPVPHITRKTDKGIPRYTDEFDTFVFSGAEDLVPGMTGTTITEVVRKGYTVREYLPRIQHAFSRIERFTNTDLSKSGDVYWRVLTSDNHCFIFGKDESSRISDGPGNGRIYSWLLCQSYDCYGNVIEYSYKPEDTSGVPALPSERNRTADTCARNRYLKSIKYGNRVSRLLPGWDQETNPWMFEVVFDYGEHDSALPTTAENALWTCRPDPFSSYRAGFEIRTYRLCRRILMFHHLPELKVQDYLVFSTTLEYDRNRVASLLKKVTGRGHLLESGRYSTESMPALSLDYSRSPKLDDLVVQDSEVLLDLAGDTYQWIDLNSEGLPGVLCEQGGSWFYRRNLSANNFVDSASTPVPRFGPLELVDPRPVPSLNSRTTRMADLDAIGEIDLVDDTIRGFYERTTGDGWTNFRTFSSWPNVDLDQPGVRFVDLTGDGMADMMVTENEAFSWYRSRGKEGYEAGRRVLHSHDEEKGPRMVWADPGGAEMIYLSDFSGDGLLDLVRIRNGDVCYWPSLGYGEFGDKVTMDNAPWFDNIDQFTHNRLHLTDIDGSGTIDLVYLLAAGGANVYHNQSGNAWSDADPLRSFPQIDSISTVSTIDLLGTGCACLVWTRQSDHTRLRYIDLVGGRKPFLLTSHSNDLGLQTKVSYTPSTRFYLDAQESGRPWVTRLPFPVHCVQKTEVFDHVSRSYFSTRYAYHHGFYDRVEREFRGFGMVEEWDAEEYNSTARFPEASNMEEAYVIAPVHKKTWFHTGAVMASPALVAHQFTADYFESKPLLEESLLPTGLTTEEYQEAFRSLKGSPLRTELYLDDGSALCPIPVRVEETSYAVDMRQLRNSNRHAVFLVRSQETVTVSHERETNDPRVTHAMNLKFDDYGNVLQSVSISYGRRPSSGKLCGISEGNQKTVKAIQQERQVIYSDHQYTRAIKGVDFHRNPELCGTSDYQVTGLTAPTDASLMFRLSDVMREASNIFAAATEVEFEDTPDPSAPAKRLVASSFKLFRSDDLGKTLQRGEIESRALPGESFQLAFTPGLLEKAYQGIDVRTEEEMTNIGGYVLLGNKWWRPSGTLHFCGSSSTETIEGAIDQFFTFTSFRDKYGESHVKYDCYHLLPEHTIDAVDSVTSVQNDYVHLQPDLVTDCNGNRTEILRSPLGEVVAMAVMGKRVDVVVVVEEENEGKGVKEEAGPSPVGDSLTGFHWTISKKEMQSFLSDPKHEIASQLLSHASTRSILVPHYSPTNSTPFAKATISRVIHAADDGDGSGILLVQFTYYDGLGRPIQVIKQADDVTEASAPNWHVSGWTVFNNKGLPVKQYQPFFHESHEFKNEAKYGSSAMTLFYDPLGRAVGSLSQNHTWTKVVYGSWQRMIYDASDNVLLRDPRKDPHVGHFFRGLWGDIDPPPDTWYSERIKPLCEPLYPRTTRLSTDPMEREAANKSAVHNDTPTVVHLDNLGRDFVTVLDNGCNGAHEYYASRNVFDIKGNIVTTIDAEDRDVTRTEFDMLGRGLRRSTMDFGEEWWVHDTAGNILERWQDNNIRIRTVYDPLHRPIGRYTMNPGSSTREETLFESFKYGEWSKDHGALNVNGRLHKVYDRSGLVVSGYDFKGNLIRTDHHLLSDHKSEINWAVEKDQTSCLEPAVATKTMSFDALNRVTEVSVTEDSEIPPKRIQYIYNCLSLVFSTSSKWPSTATPNPDWDPVVLNTHYDALGRKTAISYANKTTTKYEYDPVDLSLRRVHTVHTADKLKKTLQDLKYTYDAEQNITHIKDNAQQDIYFRNTCVTPDRDYTYDAINRLIQASGREGPGSPVIPNQRGSPVSLFTEFYSYSSTGNILSMKHQTSDGENSNWKRLYTYAERSPLQSEKFSNRLSSTMVGKVTDNYTYDTHGNMTSRPGIQVLKWDFQNQLIVSSAQRSLRGATYYNYDSAGIRVRKTTEGQSSSLKPLCQTVYLGGYEIFRKFDASGELLVKRCTLSVGEEPVCRVENEWNKIQTNKTVNNDSVIFRFQLLDHVGSIAAELDINGTILSYSEYSAFGKTVYSAQANSELVPRAYRFSGKEKDPETDLYYFGARYYDAALGRWTAPDPIGLGDGLNVYCYVRCNPVMLVDPDGRTADEEFFAAVAKLPQHQQSGQLTKEYHKRESKIESSWNMTVIPSVEPGEKYNFLVPRLEGFRAGGSNGSPVYVQDELLRISTSATSIMNFRKECGRKFGGVDRNHQTRIDMWQRLANRAQETREFLRLNPGGVMPFRTDPTLPPVNEAAAVGEEGAVGGAAAAPQLGPSEKKLAYKAETAKRRAEQKLANAKAKLDAKNKPANG